MDVDVLLLAAAPFAAVACGGAGFALWAARQRRLIDYGINSLLNAQAELSDLLLGGGTRGRADARVVCAMTTTAGRLATVHLAVQSILLQSVRPRETILYLSDALTEADLPPRLAGMRRYGLTIRFVPDVGPHTKLLYALRDYPGSRIATFDDDVLYPSNVLATLIAGSDRWPGAVVANWARRLRFDRYGRPRALGESPLLTPPLLVRRIEQRRHEAVPSALVYPYGTGGILYPPGALDPRVQDVALLRSLCPSEDDVWVKAMALLSGTPAVTTGLGVRPSHHVLRGTQGAALRHANHQDLAHVRQLRATFAHFGIGPNGPDASIAPAPGSAGVRTTLDPI